jgi:glycine cleavage system H protein
MFVILTFVGFILADGIVQYLEARKERPATQSATPVRPVAHPVLPGGIFVGGGHTWVEIVRDGRARVGSDAFLTQLLGRIEGVELPRPGQTVKRGETLFVLHIGSQRAVVQAPVDGVVRRVNNELQAHPQLLFEEPYDEGWICEVEPRDLGADMALLRVGRAAQEWITQEMDRLREFLTRRANGRFALALPDGGDIRVGVLADVDAETWEAFQHEFLQTGHQV